MHLGFSGRVWSSQISPLWFAGPAWSRLKVEELEGERSRLEEEKKVLETQLERLTLQASDWASVSAAEIDVSFFLLRGFKACHEEPQWPLVVMVSRVRPDEQPQLWDRWSPPPPPPTPPTALPAAPGLGLSFYALGQGEVYAPKPERTGHPRRSDSSCLTVTPERQSLPHRRPARAECPRSQATSDHTIVRPRPRPLHLGARAVEAAGEGSTPLRVAWLPPGSASSVRPQNRGFVAWAEREDTGRGAQLACSSPGCVCIRAVALVSVRSPGGGADPTPLQAVMGNTVMCPAQKHGRCRCHRSYLEDATRLSVFGFSWATFGAVKAMSRLALPGCSLEG
ncbi:hypothetical protein J1605_019548 [Eschrichtius robustus]|uniref:Uncharacterized protein n=1 Tax=Eschrichtius robustus TaxID=9764 RepID=A0AB34HKM5_ESCRO|nr:hypothetical protein J1605_019548 [Eschrichtius robustus]